MSSSLYVYANITHKKRKVNSRRRKNFKKRTIDHKIRHLDQKKRWGALRLGYGDIQLPGVRDMHASTLR